MSPAYRQILYHLSHQGSPNTIQDGTLRSLFLPDKYLAQEMWFVLVPHHVQDLYVQLLLLSRYSRLSSPLVPFIF